MPSICQTLIKVVFYWDQLFQPPPVWVYKVDFIQYNTFPTVSDQNAATFGNSPCTSYNHAT